MYDCTYQPNDILGTMAMMNKIAYTKRWGNFIFSPGLRFRFYKKNRSESINPLEHYMMRIPLVMLKYVFSQKTDFTLGLQGIPGLEFRYKDYIQSRNNYNTKIYNLQIQNKSIYFGYIAWVAFGVTFSTIDYDKVYRKIEETKSSSTYVRVYLGW